MNAEYIDDWIQRVASKVSPPDLIENVLADTNEVSAVAGRSEIGKTNLCLQLSFCLSTGTPFLEFPVPRKTSVAYIGFEGDEHQLMQRVRKIQPCFPDTPYLWVKPMCPIFKLKGAGISEFRALIDGFQVIVIDPVRYMVPGDYMDPKDVTSFMEKLQEEMRLNRSLAIVVLYHKKMDSRTLMEPGDLWQLKGATEWGDMCSTVLMAERTRQVSTGGRGPGMGFQPVNKDKVTLHFAKSRNAISVLDPLDLLFDRTKCLFEKI